MLHILVIDDIMIQKFAIMLTILRTGLSQEKIKGAVTRRNFFVRQSLTILAFGEVYPNEIISGRRICRICKHLSERGLINMNGV